MDYYAIDRFEGGFAVCEDDGGALHSIPRELIPPDAREGDVLRAEGERFVPDPRETQRRRTEIEALEKELFGD